MNKEEIINYLLNKQQLTAKVQNARYRLAVANDQLNHLKGLFTMFMIILVISGIIMPIIAIGQIFVGDDGQWLSVWFFAWWAAFIGLIIYRVVKGVQAKNLVKEAQQSLNNEENQEDYLVGSYDFPHKFYSYWTIDRLINLVQQNRATTLQEAYNIAENQDFQNDQLALQQQNLQVNQTTATMASIGAAASVYNALKK